MRNLTPLAAGAALLLASCSSGDSEIVGGADLGSSAVDRTGESGFTASQDIDPEAGSEMAGSEKDSPFVTVVVELPANGLLIGTAIIALEDITYTDVAAPELDRIELPVSDLRSQGNMVDLYLPVPLDGQTEVNASVHIDTDSDGAITQGDWISPNIVLVSSFTGSTVVVTIVEV